MWILPKQLHTCHSVQVMTESESDLKEFYQTCEQSLMWRSKPSQSQTWSRRWKANSWMQHLSTRMLKPSHTKSFVEEWTSYQEDSLANPSVMLELKKELKTLATFIPTSVEESKNVNQELFSSKTLKELSQAKQQKENQFSTMCLKTWKDWVTKQRQEYSLRVKSASHIREKESSLWGTPTLDSTTERTKKYSQGGKPLTLAVKEVSEKNWATPNTMDYRDPRTYEAAMKQATESRKGRKDPCNLREQIDPTCLQAYKDAMNYPTPRTSDAEGCLTEQVKNWGTPTEQMSRAANFDRGKHNIGEQVHGMYNQSQDQTNNNTNGKSLVLNPSWVEQLMGLTVGWTDCDFSEME